MQAQIDQPAILIRIARLYRPGMSDLELYEATRGVWRVGERRERAQLALSIVDRIVVEVYEIDAWHRSGATAYQTRRQDFIDGRWEFTGRVASEELRQQLIGRSVDRWFPKGAQTPIRYVNC